ncbi:MAG: GIY-YIG nuclease family protein [Bifidobacterium sp.]|uniref:GIY-YIG nuclease family protein n=1 Tax=Bifidobacterium fermentum TaxID=3059035 RepID=A0AB39UAA7_9BIFI
METIQALPLLGINEQNIDKYAVRLSRVLPGYNPTTVFFNSNGETRDELNNHMFGYRWPGDRRTHRIHGEIVLQFLQIDKFSSSYVFAGAYHVGSVIEKGSGFTIYDWHGQEISDYHAFIGRLVVNYPRKPGYTGMDFRLNKVENAKSFMESMTVESVEASPLTARPFPGYANVRINHAELVSAVNNSQWRTALDNVQGVYLQTDTSNGWHYVGSAYSQQGEHIGILSRWEEYAGGDHTGGNKLLQAIPNASFHIEQYFEYSILEIFDMHAKSQDIINREHWWMKTLSSLHRETDLHPHGYNN